MEQLSIAGQGALLTVFYVAGPILAVIMTVGALVSVFQAATQINELTLSFVPKFIGTGVVLTLLGPWLLRQLESFAILILAGLTQVVS